MTTPAVDPNAELLARGVAALNAGRFAEASTDLDAFVRACPSHALGRFEQARACLALKRWGQAVDGFSEALRLDPGLVDAWYNRAIARGRMGDHARGVEDALRFTEQRPNDGWGWTQVGNRRLDVGDFPGALEAYEKGAGLDAAVATAVAPWIDIARTLAALRKDGPAEAYAKACCERGWAKFHDQDDPSALLWFERATEAAPGLGEGWFGRGDSLWRMGRTAEGLADLEKAAALSPDNALAWADLAALRRTLGDLPGARAAWDEALRRKPDHLSALYGRGQLRGEAGDFEGAEADFAAILALAPEEALAWLNRGWARRKRKNHAGAIEDLTRSLALDGGRAQTYFNRGHCRQETGDAEGARADFRKAVELDPAYEPELRPLLTPAAPPGAFAQAVPAPPSKASAFFESFEHFKILLGLAAALAVVGILQIPYLSAIPARGVDFLFKPAWIVMHWNDDAALPPGKDLCKQPFCTTPATRLVHVTGRPGYRSETRWSMCDAHDVSFLSFDSRLDFLTMGPYAIAVVALVVCLILPATALALRLLLLPLLLVLVLVGRQPRTILIPFHDASTGGLAFQLDRASEGTGFVMCLVLPVLYMWF